ncbi:MAG: LytR/AlgR family response regulator transcription factor [Alkaliphilus sp.]
MINVLIVDDEKYIREELTYLLGKFDDVNVCAEAETGKVALEIVEKTNVDAVFLDIQLRSTKGMLIAKKIIDISDEILIVMATAHQEYAIQSYDLEIFDYLLKPFSEERIRKTIERIRRQMKDKTNDRKKTEEFKIIKEKHGKLCVLDNDKIKVVDISDLSVLEYKNNQTMVHTSKGVYHTNATLKDLELQLPDKNFIRTHRAFIVNIDYIDEITPWFNYTYKLRIRCLDEEIPVSRNYMKSFKERVNLK